MATPLQYQVIASTDLGVFNRAVNAHLQQGWSLEDSHQSSRNSNGTELYSQAMTRYFEVKE